MEEYFFHLFKVNTRSKHQSTKRIPRPEERDTYNVCFLNCNLFEFFMKQSKDCLPLVPSFTSFQEEKETFASRNKVSPAVQCP